MSLLTSLERNRGARFAAIAALAARILISSATMHSG
jgi:hypothetical protein